MKHNQKPPIAIALGFFDGVHRGHAALLDKVVDHSAVSAALTFDQHPGTLLGKNMAPLLTSVDDRVWLLKHHYHVEQVIVSEFSLISNMEWDVFIEEFLQKQWNVTHVVAGHDFRFGRGGVGTPEKLQKKCSELQMTCEIIPPVFYDDIIVSSTGIRTLLLEGLMEEATQFLSHPHILSNKVVHGNKIGTNVLGFPTVNLSIPPHVIVPRFGVYACGVYVGEKWYKAVTNVGIRPTVEESKKDVTVEGYLLDFTGEALYGKRLFMEFYKYIREEQKFANFAALTAQIAIDVEKTRKYFKKGYLEQE